MVAQIKQPRLNKSEFLYSHFENGTNSLYFIEGDDNDGDDC